MGVAMLVSPLPAKTMEIIASPNSQKTFPSFIVRGLSESIISYCLRERVGKLFLQKTR